MFTIETLSYLDKVRVVILSKNNHSQQISHIPHTSEHMYPLTSGEKKSLRIYCIL